VPKYMLSQAFEVCRQQITRIFKSPLQSLVDIDPTAAAAHQIILAYLQTHEDHLNRYLGLAGYKLTADVLENIATIMAQMWLAHCEFADFEKKFAAPDLTKGGGEKDDNTFKVESSGAGNGDGNDYNGRCGDNMVVAGADYTSNAEEEQEEDTYMADVGTTAKGEKEEETCTSGTLDADMTNADHHAKPVHVTSSDLAQPSPVVLQGLRVLDTMNWDWTPAELPAVPKTKYDHALRFQIALSGISPVCKTKKGKGYATRILKATCRLVSSLLWWSNIHSIVLLFLLIPQVWASLFVFLRPWLLLAGRWAWAIVVNVLKRSFETWWELALGSSLHVSSSSGSVRRPLSQTWTITTSISTSAIHSLVETLAGPKMLSKLVQTALSTWTVVSTPISSPVRPSLSQTWSSLVEALSGPQMLSTLVQTTLSTWTMASTPVSMSTSEATSKVISSDPIHSVISSANKDGSFSAVEIAIITPTASSISTLALVTTSISQSATSALTGVATASPVEVPDPIAPGLWHWLQFIFAMITVPLVCAAAAIAIFGCLDSLNVLPLTAVFPLIGNLPPDNAHANNLPTDNLSAETSPTDTIDDNVYNVLVRAIRESSSRIDECVNQGFY
jgi:hypothetical protein